MLLTVSRLVERKGHDMVIKTLPKLIEKFPNIIYLIVGTGPYESHLKQMVDTMDLHKYVKFLGYIPNKELIGYYQLCDIFIMPGREEDDDVEGFVFHTIR